MACTAYYQDETWQHGQRVRSSNIHQDGPASASCAAGRTTWTGPTRDDTFLFIAVAGGLPLPSLADRLLLRAASVIADARQQAFALAQSALQR